MIDRLLYATWLHSFPPTHPVMSFVTYVLLYAVYLGLAGKFRPDSLGTTAFYALGRLAFEFGFIKIVAYIIGVQGDHYGSLDMLSYLGYKFVPACLTLGSNAMGMGRLVWWCVFVYTHSALAFFLVSRQRSRARACGGRGGGGNQDWANAQR